MSPASLSRRYVALSGAPQGHCHGALGKASGKVEPSHQGAPLCPQAPMQRASGHQIPTMEISMGSWSQTLSALVMAPQQTSLVSEPCHHSACRRSRLCEYWGNNSSGDSVRCERGQGPTSSAASRWLTWGVLCSHTERAIIQDTAKHQLQQHWYWGFLLIREADRIPRNGKEGSKGS